MATKKTDKATSTKTKAAPKAKAATTKTAKAPKAPKAEQPKTARHPKARVTEKFGDKAALAKQLAPALVRGEEKANEVEARLKTASNSQLLRLQKAVTTMSSKWGSRDKLIAAIGTAQNKSKDKDYLAKLATYTLPQLVDLGLAGERRARA
ncbi:MAG TPA: hypothetical protein VM513_20000 [Kofleriaceae bacterium]|jgi:hypothetical protein|nr:hypothetical protein [Kofleriaceae bacterium]